MKTLIILFLCFLSSSSFAKEFLNQKYGPHARHEFDLWSHDSRSIKYPLVIYIHGGGFSSGDKNLIHQNKTMLESYQKAGFAVATINYRFLKHTSLQNIMREDIAGFVQFIRHNANIYNIDSRYIFALGASAGGSASLFLGVHPDLKDSQSADPIKRQSSRITAFAHINAQAGYDFLDWFDYFGEELTKRQMQDQLWSRYHLNSLNDLTTIAGESARSTLDSIENMSEDDAAMYIYNSYDLKDINSANYDYYIHGPHHAEVLINRAHAVKLSVKSVIKSQGDSMPNLKEDIKNFFLIELMKAKQKRILGY
jgi:acetyl esterase